MKIKNILIIGCGDVGSAWYRLLTDLNYRVQRYDPEIGFRPIKYRYDVIHVCIPWSKDYVEQCKSIFHKYKAPVIIFESTVKIDTFEGLEDDGPLYIYSPVRGTHPRIKMGLLEFPKFLAPIHYQDGGKFIEMGVFAHNYHTKLGIQIIFCHDYKAMILGKLLSTTWYGLQIAFCNHVAAYTMKNEIDFHEAYDLWMKTDKIGLEYGEHNGRASARENIPRPTMVPGKIGGHCVMPNLELLPFGFSSLKGYIEGYNDWREEKWIK